MKKCIEENGSMICSGKDISANDGALRSTDAASYTKDDIEWWFNEEISYTSGLNCIDGNWYYFLFNQMAGYRH